MDICLVLLYEWPARKMKYVLLTDSTRTPLHCSLHCQLECLVLGLACILTYLPRAAPTFMLFSTVLFSQSVFPDPFPFAASFLNSVILDCLFHTNSSPLPLLAPFVPHCPLGLVSSISFPFPSIPGVHPFLLRCALSSRICRAQQSMRFQILVLVDHGTQRYCFTS